MVEQACASTMPDLQGRDFSCHINQGKNMDYRMLGHTGVNVAPLALGTDNFMDPTPADESSRILQRALAAGINLIDTGDTYGTGEKIIGETIERLGNRHSVLIATKVDHGQRRPG
jgi:aryl-alcohol dehydrogenase-like predicted oxidoreductase